jgi:acetyl-CoA carboxylase biotin carboxylase subunit
MTAKRFKRVLVANRGEIAVRIIRTLRELGIESVAVYSDADQDSLHRTLADFAVRLPGNTSAETYLRIDLLADAVKRSGADAVHPGYGFVSENPAFARTVAAAGATFIGPPPKAMELMGNKVTARELMKKHGVPVVPGAAAPLKDLKELQTLAKDVGYPMILKAANGGGGRGMRVVRKDSELAEAFAACQREAKAYFGDEEVFAERYIEEPRHIEFQVLFDTHGSGIHLGERDCSIQRRHQKLLEEAPSPFLDEKQRQKIGDAAVAAAKAAGYVGAGTIEFICESPDKAYFMEMNTRIQVEHPVTEMITGFDLIGWQIRVAQGEKLPVAQKDVRLNGWAIEARINAEDPARGFAPEPGRVGRLHLPAGPFVRVDTHLYPGYQIPAFYDSMVAKVIVWGETRAVAIARLKRALSELRIEGVPTTASFHEALCDHPDFLRGQFTTRFLDTHGDKLATHAGGAVAGDAGIQAVLAGVLTAHADQSARVVDAAPRPAWTHAARTDGMEDQR